MQPTLLGILISHSIVKLPLLWIQEKWGGVHCHHVCKRVLCLDPVLNLWGEVVSADVWGPVVGTVQTVSGQ
jgi:hypothetical protein